MQRRRFITATSAMLAVAQGVGAQQADRVHRIRHLSASGEAPSCPFIAAPRHGMRALGYVEPRNLALDERYADGRMPRLPTLAQELIQRRPDVLLGVATTPGNVAAKAATATIPIVMVLVADPVGAGIVSSLARPGGDITGITNIVAELRAKRRKLLKAIVPAARRVAVFANPNEQNAPLQMRHPEAAARSLGVRRPAPSVSRSRPRSC